VWFIDHSLCALKDLEEEPHSANDRRRLATDVLSMALAALEERITDEVYVSEMAIMRRAVAMLFKVLDMQTLKQSSFL
jgi:hypothetical protein